MPRKNSLLFFPFLDATDISADLMRLISELRNVTNMTNIFVYQYLQVGVKSLGEDAIWPNLAFLASQDALEVMRVTDSLTDSLTGR